MRASLNCPCPAWECSAPRGSGPQAHWHPAKRFCSRPSSGAMLDTHREENTSKIPREAGLETWGAGSPSRGTSCPVIVLAPVGAEVPACGPSAPKSASCGRASLRRTVSGAGGVGCERRWRGRGHHRIGRACPPLGDTSPVCPRVAPRPTTSETRLSPTGGLASGEVGHEPPHARLTPRTGLRGAWRQMRWVVTFGDRERTLKGKSLIGGSVVSGAGCRFEFGQQSDDNTVASLAYTQVKRVFRAFLPGGIQLIKERVILQN